jgi:hypothetical protein
MTKNKTKKKKQKKKSPCLILWDETDDPGVSFSHWEQHPRVNTLYRGTLAKLLGGGRECQSA